MEPVCLEIIKYMLDLEYYNSKHTGSTILKYHFAG